MNKRLFEINVEIHSDGDITKYVRQVGAKDLANAQQKVERELLKGRNNLLIIFK
jgi:hypothetical protein